MIDLSKLTDADIGRWVVYLRYKNANETVPSNYKGQIKAYDSFVGIVKVYWPNLKKTQWHYPSCLEFTEPPEKELFDKQESKDENSNSL